MPIAFLGLGSNLGDRERNLRTAVERIDRPDIRVKSTSSLYETKPVGETSTGSPRYLNQAISVETELSPRALLDRLQEVEAQGGRVRTGRWSPRTIDVDILLYDDLSIESEDLTVPHPRMLERAFVLVPLAEIAADRILPDGKTVGQWLKNESIQTQILQGEVMRLQLQP